MRVAKGMCLSMLVILCVFGVLGCGKSKEGAIEIKVDEKRPVSEIKNEAKKMDVEQLKEAAMAYKEKIAANTKESKELLGKMAGVVTAKLSMEEIKALQGDIENLNEVIIALRERFKVYYDTLKEKGGDVSGLELQK